VEVETLDEGDAPVPMGDQQIGELASGAAIVERHAGARRLLIEW
jgi:hypothetical protein